MDKYVIPTCFCIGMGLVVTSCMMFDVRLGLFVIGFFFLIYCGLDSQEKEVSKFKVLRENPCTNKDTEHE